LEDRLAPATFAVTNLADSGSGSLRYAISSSNSLPGADTITFQSGLTGTITLTTGELLISSQMAIQGPGASQITISGNNASRVFKIDTPSSKTPIAISGLTLANGYSDGNGGCIRNKDEALTLTDCIVTGNNAILDGGGIFVYNSAGSLTLIRSAVSNNTAPYGGGIDFFQGGGGSLVVIDSTISGNAATGVPGLPIDGCGGGIYFSGTVGTGGLIIRNSTISGNTASGSGAGICVANLTGNLIVQNSTITANINTNGKGGGIARLSGTGGITIDSTIVYGNSSPTGIDLFSTGTITANHCAIGNKAGVTTFNGDPTTNELLSEDPLLGGFGDYGGPTLTHSIMDHSPCIDSGSNPANLNYDQRGIGFNRVMGGGCDIGAYEIQPPPGFAGQPVIINSGNAQRSSVTQLVINFSQVVTLPPNPETAFELKRQSDGQYVGLVANVVNTSTTQVTLTFAGPLTEAGSLRDGRYTLKMFSWLIYNDNGILDGDGDGVAGGDYVLTSTGSTGVFRLYGDNNGDAIINAVDFAAFRTVFGLGASIFDFNGDGRTDADDFAQFQKRFGTGI